MAGPPQKVSPEMKEQMKARYEAGHSLKAIGYHFGVTPQSVVYHLRKMGIPIRRSNPKPIKVAGVIGVHPIHRQPPSPSPQQLVPFVAVEEPKKVQPIPEPVQKPKRRIIIFEE